MNIKPSQKDIVGQSLGIDVSKDDIQCCYCYMTSKKDIKIKGSTSFENTAKGFKELEKWLKRWLIAEMELTIVMEATGVYYENLAYFLAEREHNVCVLLPNMVKSFAKSLNIKSKNDKVDSKILAQMGLERNLKAWQPPSKDARLLKELTRERDMLIKDKTATMNQLHSLEHAKDTNKPTIKRAEERIALLVKQIKSIENQIDTLIKSNADIKQSVARLISIPGVGVITAAIVLAETDFFKLFRNKSQLVSYAGLDIIERQSGTSIAGVKRISKKGNAHLRKILYLPAMVHIGKKSMYVQNYLNIVERTRIKKKGIIAVQRKLLVLMYALHKKQEDFNPSYLKENTRGAVLVGGLK